MKKILVTLAAVITLALAPTANAHGPSNTGWSCQGTPWGTIVPYAPSYYLYCGLSGSQFYWFLVHVH